MKLAFVSADGREACGFVIDRASKSLEMVSSKTGYALKKFEWKMLFDSEEETERASKLTDEDFVKEIVKVMAKNNYFKIDGS